VLDCSLSGEEELLHLEVLGHVELLSDRPKVWV